MTEARLFAGLGALLAGLAVVAGAFGAHALRARIDPAMLAVFETGARYQMYHALALLALAWATVQWQLPHASVIGWLFIAGIMLFSGSLYALALTNTRGFGAVTPIGGVAFIAGWGVLAWDLLLHR